MSNKAKKKSLPRSALKKALFAKDQVTKATVPVAIVPSDDDPVWRTIKNDSSPIRSGTAAYNLFKDQFENNPPLKKMGAVAASETALFASDNKAFGTQRPVSFKEADWSVGDAVRERLQHASIHGQNSANTRTHLISNLSAGKLVDLDRSTADKFRRGRLPIEGRLDLHGLTQDESMSRLARFIEFSHRQGKRCLIVVTGKGDPRKGGGVLKRQVPEWLDMSPNREKILAISKAQGKDGGGGALYVLLKRIRG